jgi:hypothetical protein
LSYVLHQHITTITTEDKPLREMGGTVRRLDIGLGSNSNSNSAFDMDLTDKRRQAMAKSAAKTDSKKGSKTGSNSSGGAASGKYAFAEFDPNKRLRKQGKLGKSQFKSKAKFKRRK